MRRADSDDLFEDYKGLSVQIRRTYFPIFVLDVIDGRLQDGFSTATLNWELGIPTQRVPKILKRVFIDPSLF